MTQKSRNKLERERKEKRRRLAAGVKCKEYVFFSRPAPNHWPPKSAKSFLALTRCVDRCGLPVGGWCSVETASSQIVGDDDVGDGIEDELDVGRIRGTRHVTVDLFGRRLVFGFELRLDVGRCFAVLLRP